MPNTAPLTTFDTAPWIDTITSTDDPVRDRSLDGLCNGLSVEQLLVVARDLDQFWRTNSNLYHRVRAPILPICHLSLSPATTAR